MMVLQKEVEEKVDLVAVAVKETESIGMSARAKPG
jgi:hypothetical protein